MNRICFAMCVATAVAGLVLPCSAGEANPEPPLESAESLVGRIVQAVQGGEHFPAHDYAKLAGREDVAQEMERVFPELTPEQQKKLLGYLPSIGARKGCHRWFFSVGMTRLLVKAASSGKSYDVRDSAGTRLVRYVPDSYLRIHAATIVDAAGSGALNRESLLGKTGSHEAREFIKQSGRDSTWARLALAKLGDTSISLEFVEAFRNETNVMKKARMAGQLGYIGDAACVYALAREMRSPLIHLEKSGVGALRMEIAAALSEVYPEEPVFWRSGDGYVNDEWYLNIEQWIEKHLAMEWAVERPPFMSWYPLIGNWSAPRWWIKVDGGWSWPPAAKPDEQ